jgi:cyanophycin synthetase
MKLVEIRELDGPNIFLLTPAIKIEFLFEPDDDINAVAAHVATGVAADGDLGSAWLALIERLHVDAALESPSAIVTELEQEDHIAVAFSWRHRRAAKAIAGLVVRATLGDEIDFALAASQIAGMAESFEDSDRPEMILDAERAIPTIGITGTNGKTTTTRLLAHIVSTAGKRPGWCSTAGVYIDGECVLEGDYTGPAGARRVLLDPGVDVAVLETARGGILLRGLGYESNDVSVFTNISADHLGLLGIETVEGLATVKQTVIAVTQPTGHSVLNIDDPLVWASREATRATVFAVSPRGENREIEAHIDLGLPALTIAAGQLLFWQYGESQPIVRIDEIPITYGGRAAHMVENALCATAAAIALGIGIEPIATALRTFTSSAESNPGRLNAYQLNGATVLLDYAHNEAGLTHLLNLAQGLVHGTGIVRAVIGAAGDRTDESIVEIGRLAGTLSGEVYIRETVKYLRGRENNAELNALYIRGLEAAQVGSARIFPSELDAIKAAVADAAAGDVIATMSYEQGAEARAWLVEQGARPV